MFSIELLNLIRADEIGKIMTRFPASGRILEIGAGTGRQAMEIRQRGYDIEAIEIPSSKYSQDRQFPITDYDGRHIPFPDSSFDVVFSSNVLEHVRNLGVLQAEVKRVLRPGGSCVHVVPTHAWRFWTMLSAFPAGLQHLPALAPQLVPRSRPTVREIRRLAGVLLRTVRCLFGPFFQGRHGEHGTIFGELWRFHPRWWRRSFRRHGFEIVHEEPMGLHYTGYLLFGTGWSMADRAAKARTLGSACHLFELKVASLESVE